MKKYFIPLFFVLLGCGEHTLDEFFGDLFDSSSSKGSSDVSSSSGGGNSGGGGNFTDTSGTFVDSRDGTSYKWVKIDTLIWMSENLNYNASGRCYGEGGQVVVSHAWDDQLVTKTLSPAEIQANCTKYGRLYDWNMALTACPSGWHLPNNNEWDLLKGKGNAKSTSGWTDFVGNPAGNGTDDFGFTGLPGGMWSDFESSFRSVGFYGTWWSNALSISSGGRYAYFYSLSFLYVDVNHSMDYETDLRSIRCVKD